MIYLLSKLIVLGARRLSSLWSEPLIAPTQRLVRLLEAFIQQCR